MARGWESKSIESQQDEAARARQRPRARPRSEADRQAMARRDTLRLAHARTLADLERARRPEHRAMLQQALEALDAQLSEETTEGG